MKAYYSKDKQQADRYSDLGKNLMIKCSDFLESNKDHEASIIVERSGVLTVAFR